MTTTCTVEHRRDPDRPRRTSDGFTICGGCLRGLLADLEALPKVHDDLVYLHGARRVGGEQTKVTGTQAARLPIALNVADARKDLKDTIISWAAYAHREAASVAPLADTVTSAARWLTINAHWSAQQDWAPNLVAEIRRIHSRAARLLDPHPRQMFAIPGADGQCVRRDGDADCPGRMWVTIPAAEEESSLIYCDTCDHDYSPMQWLRLGKLVHARRTAA